MKVWEEPEVLEELVKARTAQAISNTSNVEETDIAITKVSFLLILARRYQRKHYEFVYYPADNYQRIEELFAATAVVLEDGTLTSTGNNSNNNGCDDPSDQDPTVWIDHPSSSSDDEDNDIDNGDYSRAFESYYVGKAMFHTASGEPLLNIEGSPGWREALKQKYHILDARSREFAKEAAEKKKSKKNRTATKAMASAVIGGTAATQGTAYAAGYLGYTATGIAANSAAAAIMSAEAAAAGGGVAAGGFTATMQTIGAVGVMASPVGMTLAVGGAVAGLGGYLLIHKLKKRRKKEEEEQKARELLAKIRREEAEQVLADSREKPHNETNSDEYQPVRHLDDDDTEHAKEKEKEEEPYEIWVMVTARRVEMEDLELFDHAYWEEQADAKKSYDKESSTTTAKALFDPQGDLVRLGADPSDRDGWTMALRLHYDFLVEQGSIPTTRDDHGEGARETTPLLTEEERAKK